jgi:hypothetical protein
VPPHRPRPRPRSRLGIAPSSLTPLRSLSVVPERRRCFPAHELRPGATRRTSCMSSLLYMRTTRSLIANSRLTDPGIFGNGGSSARSTRRCNRSSTWLASATRTRPAPTSCIRRFALGSTRGDPTHLRCGALGVHGLEALRPHSTAEPARFRSRGAAGIGAASVSDGGASGIRPDPTASDVF